MLKRAVRLAAINLLVFGMMAETLALVAFYVGTGWIFYAYPFGPFHEPIPQEQAEVVTLEGLHPYFGPTHMPGIRADLPDALRGAQGGAQATNNLGFVSPYDYPFAKTRDDQVVIGIFGGSVSV